MKNLLIILIMIMFSNVKAQSVVFDNKEVPVKNNTKISNNIVNKAVLNAITETKNLVDPSVKFRPLSASVYNVSGFKVYVTYDSKKEGQATIIYTITFLFDENYNIIK
ncbi:MULTISPECIES: hypothetical protein [Flavobacterium]|uniref:hypothetical protein n=1 Tax=Flavobacterium TaxID=237 RepID=UPI001FCA6D0D|nr:MULTISPECIES: hypothetical protein [Flavobacterium]UOK41898.1 hypothetical protein LZF87_11355 [Flavobacterium enshiense]